MAGLPRHLTVHLTRGPIVEDCHRYRSSVVVEDYSISRVGRHAVGAQLAAAWHHRVDRRLQHGGRIGVCNRPTWQNTDFLICKVHAKADFKHLC